MAKVGIKPLADRIVVKRIEESEAKVGSLYIPDTAREKPLQAEVLAVGPGKRSESGTRSGLDVKAGDRILIGKYAGSDVRISGVDYVIIREEDVLAILS
jgi:chaperonin GroES